MQVAVLFDYIRVSLQCVQYNMEQCNGPTGILGKLFHIEHISRHNRRIQSPSLRIGKLLLYRSNLVQHHNAEHGTGNHIECPIIDGEHFLEGVEIGL